MAESGRVSIQHRRPFCKFLVTIANLYLTALVSRVSVTAALVSQVSVAAALVSRVSVTALPFSDTFVLYLPLYYLSEG